MTDESSLSVSMFLKIFPSPNLRMVLHMLIGSIPRNSRTVVLPY